MAIPIKSPRDLDAMRRAGDALAAVLRDTMRMLRPGLTTAEIDAAVRARIAAVGAEPVMLEAGFPGAASITIDEEVSHAPPGPRVLRGGQVVTVDAALRLNGWCADAARVAVVGEPAGPDRARLAAAARGAVRAAVAAAGPGVRWSAVSRAALGEAARAGCRVVPDCPGHGIGRGLHEAPEASFAGFESGQEGSACQDFVLRPGMVLTIEPVLVLGRPDTVVLDDAWTVVTADRSAAAHEEETVAVTGTGVLVLTAG